MGRGVEETMLCTIVQKAQSLGTESFAPNTFPPPKISRGKMVFQSPQAAKKRRHIPDTHWQIAFEFPKHIQTVLDTSHDAKISFRRALQPVAAFACANVARMRPRCDRRYIRLRGAKIGKDVFIADESIWKMSIPRPSKSTTACRSAYERFSSPILAGLAKS